MQLYYEIDKAAVGKRMRKERRKIRMTQEEMAEAIGVTSKYLSKMENGVQSPSLKLAMKFCDLTGTSLDYLLKGQEWSDMPAGKDSGPNSVHEGASYGKALSKKQKKICEAVLKSLAQTLIENDV